MIQGKFITLEGGEGAGKSTQLPAIADWLAAHDIDVVMTREPGGTQLGEAVRAVLMADYVAPMPALSELLLMFAARAAHMEQVIEPALARGAWVVSDRFTDASYAYQGAARGLGDEAVALLETLVQGTRRPDRVLLFDLPTTTGLARRHDEGQANRFDAESQAFHETVAQAYRERARKAPQRYAVINAEAAADAVFAQIAAVLEPLL